MITANFNATTKTLTVSGGVPGEVARLKDDGHGNFVVTSGTWPQVPILSASGVQSVVINTSDGVVVNASMNITAGQKASENWSVNLGNDCTLYFSYNYSFGPAVNFSLTERITGKNNHTYLSAMFPSSIEDAGSVIDMEIVDTGSNNALTFQTQGEINGVVRCRYDSTGGTGGNKAFLHAGLYHGTGTLDMHGFGHMGAGDIITRLVNDLGADNGGDPSGVTQV